MDEGERRAGGVQLAVYKEPLISPPPGTLEMLFREHHGAVYRAAYRITGNAMDAEDVLLGLSLKVTMKMASSNAGNARRMLVTTSMMRSAQPR